MVIIALTDFNFSHHLSHYFNCAINVQRANKCHVGDHEKLLN
jgi:hypothetical protein